MKKTVTLTVNVTEQDITQSRIPKPVRRCMTCPIALAATRAVREHFGENYFVATAHNDLCVYENIDDADGYKNEIYRSHSLPAEANDFISRADGGATVKPFSFEVTITRQ